MKCIVKVFFFGFFPRNIYNSGLVVEYFLNFWNPRVEIFILDRSFWHCMPHIHTYIIKIKKQFGIEL